MRATMIPLACALAALQGGCGQRSSGPVASAPVLKAEDHWDSERDQRLAGEIRAAFDADQQMSADAAQISIVVKDSDVQLLGKVGSMQVKGEAGVRARWVAGIDRVDNQIAVPSSDPNPADAP